MSTGTDALGLNVIAGKVLSSLSSHRQIPSLSRSFGQLSIADAYRLTPLLRAAFEARGEKITGRKIGFTNRQMWAAHGVRAPNLGLLHRPDHPQTRKCTRSMHEGFRRTAHRAGNHVWPPPRAFAQHGSVRAA